MLRLAGPLVYAAEEEQIGDQMFANRRAPAQAILAKLGYHEAVQASDHLLRKKAEIPRHLRPFVGYKDPLIDPLDAAKQSAAYRDLIDAMKLILIDNPLEAVTLKDDRTNWQPVTTDLDDLLATIEAAKPLPTPRSIADEVAKIFKAQLDAADGTGAKLKLCRAELVDPERKNAFHKLVAMSYLAETLGADSVLPEVLDHLAQSTTREDQLGCEEALLSRRDESAHATRVRDAVIAMLNHSMDTDMVAYLSHIPEAEALRALMFCLRKGVTPAAENLVKCAEGIDNLAPADAKIAAKAIQDVIEYIEVTRLRGGLEAHMDKDDKYLEWKALQARAGSHVFVERQFSIAGANKHFAIGGVRVGCAAENDLATGGFDEQVAGRDIPDADLFLDVGVKAAAGDVSHGEGGAAHEPGFAHFVGDAAVTFESMIEAGL